jgi:hypothetical protein
MKTSVKHVMNTSKISGSDGRSGRPDEKLKHGIEFGNADWWNTAPENLKTALKSAIKPKIT